MKVLYFTKSSGLLKTIYSTFVCAHAHFCGNLYRGQSKNKHFNFLIACSCTPLSRNFLRPRDRNERKDEYAPLVKHHLREWLRPQTKALAGFACAFSNESPRREPLSSSSSRVKSKKTNRQIEKAHPIHVVSENIWINHGDRLQSQESNATHDPRRHQCRSFLQHMHKSNQISRANKNLSAFQGRRQNERDWEKHT